MAARRPVFCHLRRPSRLRAASSGRDACHRTHFEVVLDILWDVEIIDVPALADQVRLIHSSQGAGIPET
jgi:uncharacterized protein with HEPN domain